ncbi:MAG: hypothetical protein OXC57_10170 [Rhodobacteraceae bacterium]|nr:hypothetical protein [Paracoccaceae bacterium]
MARHSILDLDFRTGVLTHARNASTIAEGEHLDDFQVIRTKVEEETVGHHEAVRACKHLGKVERAFRFPAGKSLPSLAGRPGPLACVPVHAGLLYGMAHASPFGSLVVCR